jgi:hypothetical protein
MASGSLGAAAPNENLPADNAPQLAAGLFTLGVLRQSVEE